MRLGACIYIWHNQQTCHPAAALKSLALSIISRLLCRSILLNCANCRAGCSDRLICEHMLQRERLLTAARPYIGPLLARAVLFLRDSLDSIICSLVESYATYFQLMYSSFARILRQEHDSRQVYVSWVGTRYVSNLAYSGRYYRQTYLQGPLSIWLRPTFILATTLTFIYPLRP